MPDDDKTPTAIRLNILGCLEIERDGECLPLPKTAAAHRLIALFAVEDRYQDQALVDNLWPGDSLTDTRLGVPKAVRARLDRAVSDARTALGVRASSGVLKRESGIVYRARGNTVTITTDLDDFRRLSQSDQPADWQAALALVRGRVAQTVPTRGNRRTDWIEREQGFQSSDIKALLKRLDPDAKDEVIECRAQEVLDGRGSLVAAGTSMPESDAETQTTADMAPDVKAPPLPSSRLNSPTHQWLTKRLVATGFVATLVIAGVALLVLSGHGHSIPPEGSVINAETGAIIHHPQVTASSMPAQIGGGAYFRACDLATLSSCGSGHNGPTPLRVNAGDIVIFRISLNDGSGSPVHNVKLEIHSQPRVLTDTESEGPSASQTELEINASVKWPETLGRYEIVNEPDRIDNHANGGFLQDKTIYLQLLHPGHYSLVYIPGSTTLVNKETHFLHYLPDGIMRYGIELENVGPPPSCCWCARQYIRHVYFHARVISTSK